MGTGHILETDRLILRQFKEEDAHAFFELNSDPEVIRYTGDEAFENLQAARAFILAYEPYKRDGFGRWAVELKATNEFVGFCGLRLLESGEVDLGFRFHRKHWGQGYATESAKACLSYGFNKLNLKRIIGRAALENKASIAVLEKIGMSYSHGGDCHGQQAAIYTKDQQA